MDSRKTAKSSTSEVATPVHESGEGEEDAEDGNDPGLSWGKQRGQRQDAEREPDQLFESVLHDLAVNLKALALVAEKGVVAAFVEALIQDGQAHGRVWDERDEQPLHGKQQPLDRLGEALGWRHDCVGRTKETIGPRHGDP